MGLRVLRTASGAPANAAYVVTTLHPDLTGEQHLGGSIIMDGLEAALPVASKEGRLYFATDTLKLFRDVLTEWVLVTPATQPEVTLGGSERTVLNMPAAEAELFGSSAFRARVDLTHVRQARFGVRVPGGSFFPGAIIRPKFSTDDAVFAPLAANAGELDVALDSVGTRESAWAAIAAGAKAGGVILAAFTAGGDGAVDPQIGVITVRFR